MSALNHDKIVAACPKLTEVKLDGENDYKSVQKALVAGNVKPTNKLVWACIEMLQETNQESADSFFD